MPNFDFLCECGELFEEFVFHHELVARGRQVRHSCGLMASQVWRNAPGLQSDEKPPRELVKIARQGVVHGGSGPVEPFRGESRTELREWERKHNVSAVPTDEINRGKTTLGSKPSFTKTKAFEQKLIDTIKENTEKAASGRLDEELKQLERPDEYDKGILKQQFGRDDKLVEQLNDTEKVPYAKGS